MQHPALARLALNLGLGVSTLWMSACQTTPGPQPPTAPEAASGVYRSYCLDASQRSETGHYRSGYGSGMNQRAALNQAYQDLSEKLSVLVTTTTESSTRRDRAGDVARELSNHIQTRSSAELSDVERICLDSNDPRGLVHLAIRVDLRAPATIAAEQLSQRWGGMPRHIDWHGPAALRESPFLRNLQRELAQRPSRPGTETAQLRLYHRLDRWQLAVNGEPLPTGDSGLNELIHWSALNTPGLAVTIVNEHDQPLRRQVRDGTEFRLQFNSGQSGYFSLIGIYGNGQVSIMRENLRITDTLRIPERGIFEAYIKGDGRRSREYYIALVTPGPLDIGSAIDLENRPVDLQQLADMLERQPGLRQVLTLTVEAR